MRDHDGKEADVEGQRGSRPGGVYWAPVIRQLAERYQVIVPDSPGLGASEPVTRMDAGHVPHIEQPDAFVGVLRTAIGTGTDDGTSAGSRARRSR